jgi:hypothetical protein
MARNCAPENPEIPDAQLRIGGLVLTRHPGMTAPHANVRNCGGGAAVFRLVLFSSYLL